MARLLEQYESRIVPSLMETFGHKNRLAAPRLQKIVVNMGVGQATENKKCLDDAVAHLTALAGQKAVTTIARRSVSSFKLREGNPIGCKVTLRGKRMYEFLDRLVSIALPRIRDFRGLSPKAFDGYGNYTLGITEQLVFPEISVDDVEFTQGMDITLVISGNSDEQSCELLQQLGMPFRTA